MMYLVEPEYPESSKLISYQVTSSGTDEKCLDNVECMELFAEISRCGLVTRTYRQG